MEFLFLHEEVTEKTFLPKFLLATRRLGNTDLAKKTLGKKQNKNHSVVTELYVAAENMQFYTVSM